MKSVIDSIRTDWGFHESWGYEQLLRDWERTVESMDRGYSLTWEHYTRDLAIRDEISNLIGKVPSPLATRLEEWVSPVDDTFMQATRAVDEPVLSGDDGETLGPWWYRMPLSIHSVDPDVAASWSRGG